MVQSHRVLLVQTQPITFLSIKKKPDRSHQRILSVSSKPMSTTEKKNSMQVVQELKSMWIKDLNIKPDELSLIGEKLANSSECIGTGDNFFLPFFFCFAIALF